MPEVYTYETRADMMLMDGNNHMRNSAYLEVATASRYRYLPDSGFTQERLAELGIGAVVRCDYVEYKKGSPARRSAAHRVATRRRQPEGVAVPLPQPDL